MPMMFTLPKPSDGFEWVQLQAGPGLVCRPVERYATHLFTTRPWQLGASSAANEADAWREVAAAMAVEAPRLARLRQVHGSASVTHRRGVVKRIADMPLPEADIVASDDPAVALVVQTADCVPIVVVDPRAGAVAAVHAGWRGLVRRAPAIAVERLAVDFGSRAEDLIVAVGPAISACCYEVGPDVRTEFERAGFVAAQLDRWFSVSPVASAVNPPMASLSSVRRDGHWFFDASRSAREELESAGVPPGRMFVSGLCTASHHDLFCSYRRDGAPAGRMAAAIRLSRPD
jgi:YfiH family protein